MRAFSSRLIIVSSVVLSGVTLSARVLYADVVRIEITSQRQAFNGQAFGAIGAYEEIRGLAFGEIDPRDPKNALITDIGLAPKNARGRVEYRTTFTLLKPVDMKAAPGVLLEFPRNGGHAGFRHPWLAQRLFRFFDP